MTAPRTPSAAEPEKRAEKKQAPFWERDPTQKVGPGSPPSEYQWPPGYCPNPAGRPRKKVVEMSVPNNATPLQQRLIAHANKVVGEVNGKPVTRIESLLIKLEAVADKEPAIAKLLMELYGEAEKAAEQSSLMALTAVLDYKEAMGPAFERAEKAGRPPPPCFPHPADIIVARDNTFTIVGPRTAEEAALLKAMIQYRDVLFFVVEEYMDIIPEFASVEKGRKYYDKHRRLFYRFHRHIPPRLYKKFPPFRTTPREGLDDESAPDPEMGEV
ncbi:MAG: hypothetical protein P0Y56_12520 [Candidatus Andeanibacterium colombiense]|uniref:DUF5681 domain-containing protein n=1 Tax=Candidatus Andeanibacterium colombiense TaxID=3121345 RepID=A0AAJ5X857_9SPHN|nr:MAG: hypothetical protein P0Y56_12520 [Sphingomonadaceae bacterium]